MIIEKIMARGILKAVSLKIRAQKIQHWWFQYLPLYYLGNQVSQIINEFEDDVV